MNRAQRAVVIVALATMAGLAAFPPWRCVEHGASVVAYAHAPLWAAPTHAVARGDDRYECDDARVAGDRLLASWGIVAALAAALFAAVPWRKSAP